ncbi:transcription factor TFIIIB component B'' homolog [Mercenaria mercenaria]|uniref:transcription factor TFIIIB component B'' homolog n=1 Tax=Mercenaria mercenaria TaxID=6596 RepID=UPI00234EF745|nr:transcription factor TFIIIB component B'' homolog [Mercenaria mercenaria]XP_045175420.2 transcription factor TFIIIB component B'' homolog [Mercenaria mercenaria]XP_045175421.2 transcription factor TFIIIB component B'' homolog [Mercenaria mercenaria]
MATRRSRLQIKPNILGGPKGSGPKPTPKTSGKTASKEVSDAAKLDAANEVKSPARVASPKKNIQVNPLKEISSSNEEAGNVDTENNATLLDKRTDKSGSEKLDTINDDTQVTANANKTDIPALPTRARLRKFGKVNISAARGVKTESQPSKTTEEADTGNTTEKVEGDSLKATDVPKKDDSVPDKKSSEDGSSASTTVQRRSRFPKAKPNIADAGRRRQKELAAKDEASGSSSSDKPVKVPEISVTDSAVTETNLQLNQNKPETSRSSDSTPALTQIQPRPPATPTSVLKSPLKHPTPTILVSPEKRARTLSTSEPPVVKRQKKPKVDAPTDKPPDRTTMKMKDLIRWNPSSNPMKPKVKTGTAAVAKVVEKENVNDRPVAGDEAEDVVVVNEPEAADTSLPVPQVTIGPDGNIVINEKSLIVKDPELEKAPSQENEVIDETDMFTTYGSFRKRNLSKRWSKKETKKFYKALAMIGIDFFLINQLFPNRNRFEIKKKFKKEEKVNRVLIEKVLKERIKFDPAVFDAQDSEESSDEDEQKVKNGRKKKERKKTAKEQKNQQGPAKKRTTKRKKARRNYYEDDTSDEEEEPVQKKSNTSEASSSVSQKDGEVVGILMDMSEGRITGEAPDNIINGGDGNNSEKLIAVPANKVHKHGRFIPIEAKTSNSMSQGQYSALTSANNENVSLNIPGIQSISIMQTQQIDGLGAGHSSMKLPLLLPENTVMTSQTTERSQDIGYANSESLDRRIYLPDLNRNNPAVVQSNVQQTVNVYNAEVQYNQSSVPGQEIPVVAGTSSSQLQSGTSQNQLQQVQMNSVPVINTQLSTEDADQYVLVTVMPEGGGETVIHIYRLHGGGQSQDQILYADPFASQQMTIDSASSCEIVGQQQAQEFTSSDATATVNYQNVDKAPVDLTSSNIAASDEMSNDDAIQSNIEETFIDDKLLPTTEPELRESVDITQSNIQETSVDNEFVLANESEVQESAADKKSVPESDIQVIITDDTQ